MQIHSNPLSFWEFKPKEPESILERRMVKRGNKAVTQVLFKWKGKDREDATWEEFWAMKKRFPTFNLRVEVVLKRGGLSGSAPSYLFQTD